MNRTLGMVSLTLVLSGLPACSLLGFGSAGGVATTGSQPEVGKSTPEARAALMKVTQQNLDQCEAKTKETEQKLAEALDKIGGGKPDMTGKPMPPMSEAVAELKKENVTVTIENLGTPESPMLQMKDSFMAEGQKMAGAPQAKMMAFAKRAQKLQPMLSALREQVNAVNGALGSSMMSMGACQGYAKGMTNTLAGMSNGGEEPTPELFELYGKFLAANARSQLVIASSLGTLGIVQAGFAGKDTKGVDTLANAVREAQTKPVTVSAEDAKKTYELAAKDLRDGCQENLDKYYAAHPEAKKPDGPSPCSKEGAKPKGPPKAEAAGGGGGGALGFLESLVPSDFPLAAAVQGVKAVATGDYLGAVKAGASLMPKGHPVGAALDTVLKFL